MHVQLRTSILFRFLGNGEDHFTPEKWRQVQHPNIRESGTS